MIPTMLKRSFAASLFAASLLSANTDDNMARTLMKLRAEVESLDTQIQDIQDETKATMRSLVMEKNDLDATIGRETLKIKQLRRELAKVRRQIEEAGRNSRGIEPVVREAIANLQAHIAAELPFKTQERLADVKRIGEQLDAGLVTPQKALVQVWNSYADEIRMSHENGLFKQTITLDAKERLAEVARLGTVMMYFKTPDDRVGYAAKDTNGWYYKEVVDEAGKKEILGLFDAMHKQIRSGYFTLPDAIAKSEVK